MNISLWRRQVKTIRDGASSHKMDYVPHFKSQRALKLHHRLDFSEWVDFAITMNAL